MRRVLSAPGDGAFRADIPSRLSSGCAEGRQGLHGVRHRRQDVPRRGDRGLQIGESMLDRELMKGNEALGEAAIRAGCLFYYGYPITPQTELLEYMAHQLPMRGGTCLQTESEVATIYYVYGTAAAGKRVMTASSSPGMSLMAEGMSYLATAQLPAVIVDIARASPGLGRIPPAQSDYRQLTRGAGHGDYRMPVFAPASVPQKAA